jgi:hypothetical protein
MTKPKPDQKRADPARHLHHLPSATPKPGQLLTPTNTLHSIKTLQKAGKAGKAKSEPTDNFGPAAHRRRAREARIAADPDKAPISNATSRAPLVAPRPASLRPGAEDYRQHPSLVADKRVTYAARCGA